MKKLNHIFRSLRSAMAAALLVASASAAKADAVNSGDATLSRLVIKVDGQNILPGFNKNNGNYEIELGEDASSIATFSASPTASDAIVDITVNGVPYTNHSVGSLVGGENVVTYTVKSGSATKTYNIKITTPQVLRQEYFTWKNASIYFVLTDRFYNGDTSNDESYHRHKTAGGNNVATFHGGDIKGLTQKLDYLESLGVNAVWITAPYEQAHGWTGGKNDAFAHYAFHGYYALDWTFMDRNMGTIEDMRNFVTEAHRRGIRVVMDIVLNHTGYATLDDGVDYGFGNFNGTPTAGWLPSDGKFTMWDRDGVSFNADTQGNWGKWWGPWVRAFGDRSWASSAGYVAPGNDDKTLSLVGLPDVVTERSASVNIPDFLATKWSREKGGDYDNYRLPNLEAWRVSGKGAPADYVINWLAGWVEEFGIDGFRCDTAKHVELSRWNQLKNACKTALNNWRSSSRADQYAKNWTDDFWMTGECWAWDHGDTGYFTSGGFDSMINFAFNGSSGGTGRTPNTGDWEYYANYCNGSNGRQVLNYVSSHDTGLHRPGDQKKVATMLLLCPGGSQIYYGDETSRPSVDGKGDADMSTRGDFNWDAVDNDVNKHWQLIGQFRRRNPAVGAGTQTKSGNAYLRKFSANGFTNAVAIIPDAQNGQSYTVDVSSIWSDGQRVMDGYNTSKSAVVSGGKVTMTASGPVLLLEEYGTVGGPQPPIPPVPGKPTVTASPAGGNFSESVTVTLSVNPAGIPIHYSVNGTANASSPVYSTPLTFTSTTTLSTYVENTAGSNTQSFTYTKSETPIPPVPGTLTITGDYNLAYSGDKENVYYWGGSSKPEWPGVKMATVTGSDGKTYKVFKVAEGTASVIFNTNGDQNKTGDLTYSSEYVMTDNGPSTTKVTFNGGDQPIPPTPPTPGEFTIYYDNSATNWSSVNIHYWTSPSTTWPGVAMTKVEGNVWKYTFPSDPSGLTGFLFNNGSGSGDNNQTADCTNPPAKNHIYKGAGGNKGAVTDGGEYYTGPRKPSITVTPASGNVKGATVITVSIDNEATSISGTFNGKTLSLNNGNNSVAVSGYLNDGQTGSMSITATNSVGSTSFNASFTRDDSTPVISLTGDQRELSIYQIMVGSFQHGNDGASGYSDMWGPEGHRKNGNLRGIIDALDYIQDLGMNAIWMTPVFDSTNGQGGEKLQATGYFCTNYFNIDPKFGTLAEFKELVQKAHDRGIYVILDGVFGHHGGVSSASPNGNRIDTRDNTPNVRGSESGNIAFPGSLAYFKEVVRYWMELGVDGWRLDQCYQVYQGGHNYWKDLREEVEAVARERKNRGEQWGTLGYMVGEDWTSAGNITVTQQDGLKSVMDFDGKDNLVNLSSGVGSIGWFLSASASDRGYRDSGVWPTVFLSNHDTARVGDTVTNPEQLMTRHAAVAAYSGPTCTYYGDEIGDRSGNGNDDNKARTSGRISNFNQNEQRIHDYVAKVFKARKENPALWRGSVSRDQRSSTLEVITKTDSQTGNKVICIFSQNDANVSIGGSGIDLINGGNVSGSVNVKAWVPAFIKVN